MKEIKIKNLTPHPIVIVLFKEEGKIIEIKPEENVKMRLKEEKKKINKIEGIEIFEIKRELDPSIFDYKFEEFCVYITSSIMFPELKKNFPNIIFVVPGDFVRDENGNIIGCKSFFIPV